MRGGSNTKNRYDTHVIERQCYNLSLAWEGVFLREVTTWYELLDSETAELVGAALDLLEERGPSLGRPLVDKIAGSKLHSFKELRPGSAGSSEIRVLFIFDPSRNAVLLVAGDKADSWGEWYEDNIPVAEERFEKWLAGEYDD